MLDWDDLRPILAVARGGTLAAAAKGLRIDATTVGRRIQAAETALGVRLFDRIDGRYTPTAAGELAVRHGEAIEREILALEGQVAGQDQSLEGSVRVTSVAMLVNHLLAPCLPALLAEHPKLRLELTGSNVNLSLSRREADLALRLGRPSDGSDRLRKVGVLDYGVYAARALGETAQNLPWLSYDEQLSHVPEAVWLRKQLAPGEAPVVCANQAEALRHLAARGLGRAVLPRFLAEGQKALRCLSGPEPVVRRDIWLVVHPELRKTARVSAVVDWILGVCMERLRAV